MIFLIKYQAFVSSGGGLMTVGNFTKLEGEGEEIGSLGS